MKLLIASDLHGSYPRAGALAERVREHGPTALVLLGDLLYHGPRNPLPEGYNPALTAECLNAFAGMIIAVQGNCDSEVDQMLLDFELAPRVSWILAGDTRIRAAHGHLHHTGALEGSGVLLSGHTHVPEARQSGGLHIWNPGSIALPKQHFPPSYGLFQNGRFQVLDLSSGGVIMEDTL